MKNENPQTNVNEDVHVAITELQKPALRAFVLVTDFEDGSGGTWFLSGDSFAVEQCVGVAQDEFKEYEKQLLLMYANDCSENQS